MTPEPLQQRGWRVGVARLWQVLDQAGPVPRYLLAALIFGAALWARFALVGVLPPIGFPFLSFFPAVLLAAALAGLGPSLAVSAASVLAAWYWFVPPAVGFHPVSRPDLVALIFFAGVLLIDCILVHVMRRALAQARRAEHQRHESELSARRSAETAEAERRLLEATLDAVPAGILLTDAHGRPLRSNLASARLWGAGSETGAVADPARWKGWWADGGEHQGRPLDGGDWGLARALRGERCTQIVEIEPFDRPGERRLTMLSASPVQTPDRGVTGAVVAQTDITDWRQAEAALRDSQANFRMLADNIPQLAWMTDAQGRPNWFNRRWLDFTGLPQGGVSDEDWRGVLAPDDVERVLASFTSHVARGEPWEDTFAMRRHDGVYCWFLSRALPLRDADGRVSRWFGTNTDVTEQRRTEQALRDSREQLLAREAALQQADRQKDTFLATLAHELRNPLAPIRSAAHVLRLTGSGADAAGTVQRMSAVIDRQSAQLARLVDDLLDMSRITLGQLRLQRQPVDLRRVVDTALESCRPQMEAAGHALALRMPGEPVIVDVDEARLAQALANLIDNACKFTPRGGQLELALTADAHEVRVAVQDNGRGISPQMLGEVFELFRQEQRSGMGGNTGLGIGLALTRRLVELNGGRVEARSEGEGRGTTVEIRLPPAAEAGRTPAGSGTPGARARPRRVLVVDDNPDQLESLRALLELQGHEVTSAGDGRGALEAVRHTRPDVVLLDIGLPDVDGHEVARAIRGMADLSPVPRLIALTGWGQEEDRTRALQAGFEQHLTKPADPEQLAAVMHTRRAGDRPAA